MGLAGLSLKEIGNDVISVPYGMGRFALECAPCVELIMVDDFSMTWDHYGGRMSMSGH
jgi:hypothetical protein